MFEAYPQQRPGHCRWRSWLLLLGCVTVFLCLYMEQAYVQRKPVSKEELRSLHFMQPFLTSPGFEIGIWTRDRSNADGGGTSAPAGGGEQDEVSEQGARGQPDSTTPAPSQLVDPATTKGLPPDVIPASLWRQPAGLQDKAGVAGAEAPSVPDAPAATPTFSPPVPSGTGQPAQDSQDGSPVPGQQVGASPAAASAPLPQAPPAPSQLAQPQPPPVELAPVQQSLPQHIEPQTAQAQSAVPVQGNQQQPPQPQQQLQKMPHEITVRAGGQEIVLQIGKEQADETGGVSGNAGGANTLAGAAAPKAEAPLAAATRTSPLPTPAPWPQAPAALAATQTTPPPGPPAAALATTASSGGASAGAVVDLSPQASSGSAPRANPDGAEAPSAEEATSITVKSRDGQSITIKVMGQQGENAKTGATATSAQAAEPPPGLVGESSPTQLPVPLAAAAEAAATAPAPAQPAWALPASPPGSAPEPTPAAPMPAQMQLPPALASQDAVSLPQAAAPHPAPAISTANSTAPVSAQKAEMLAPTKSPDLYANLALRTR